MPTGDALFSWHLVLSFSGHAFVLPVETSATLYQIDIIPVCDVITEPYIITYLTFHKILVSRYILNPKRNVTKKFTVLFYKMRLHGLFASCKCSARCFWGQMPNLNPVQWSETFVGRFEQFARPARYLYFRVLWKWNKLVRSKGNIPKQRKIIRNW